MPTTLHFFKWHITHIKLCFKYSRYLWLSGLKISNDKMKNVWIGKKRFFSTEKLMKGYHWDSNHLALTFLVNLKEMGNLNLESKMREIKDTINKSYLSKYAVPRQLMD